MKRTIRNITSAIALIAVAASCSNNELDNMSQNKELPLELKAEVSQGISRTESQTMRLGEFSQPVNFNLTVGELGEKSMNLSSNGVIAYVNEESKFVVNPAIPYTMSATINEVPLSFTKDELTFTFNTTLSVNKSIQPGTSDGESSISATAVLPMDVVSSGLYVKFNYGKAIPKGTIVKSFADDFESELQFSENGDLRTTADNNSIVYFVKLDKNLNADDKILDIIVSGDKKYEITTSAAIDRSLNKLFVTEAVLSSSTRSAEGSGVVTRTSAVCW